MSEPIKVGDLVRIVRDACPHDNGLGLGMIFSILAIEPARNFGNFRCACRITSGQLAYGDVGKGPGYYPVSCLRRIPPLSELDDVKQNEEIPA